MVDGIPLGSDNGSVVSENFGRDECDDVGSLLESCVACRDGYGGNTGSVFEGFGSDGCLGRCVSEDEAIIDGDKVGKCSGIISDIFLYLFIELNLLSKRETTHCSTHNSDFHHRYELENIVPFFLLRTCRSSSAWRMRLDTVLVDHIALLSSSQL